jgi:polyhydroxybutyrate depolymerase
MKNIIATICFIFSHFYSYSQDATISLTHEGQQRSFLIHSPCQSYNCNNFLLPVVFVFHCLGQTAEEIKDYALFNSIADTAGFVVIYPQGVNNGWNVGFSLGNPTTTDDVDFVETIIQFLSDEMVNCSNSVCVNIDTSQIFACGMSNGGFMSYHLACNLSKRLKAIASVTGSMTNATFDNCNPEKSMPVLEIHGDADLVVPYTGSALTGAKPIQHVLNYWRDNNNCPANSVSSNVPDIDNNDSSTVIKYDYSPCNDDSKILHYKIIGGGHSWAGAASAPALGPTNMDINASIEIWLFFKQYTGTSSVGIQKYSTNSFPIIHPNPVSNQLNISLDSQHITAFKLFDLQGKLILQENISSSHDRHSIDVSHINSKGTYILQLSDEESVYTARVVLE